MAKAKVVADLEIGTNWKGFTRYKDGLNCWYKGGSRHVCGLRTPLEEVDDKWDAKRKAVDAAANGEATPLPLEPEAPMLYREALAKFLPVQRGRIDAKTRPIRERTYHNLKVELNKFGAFFHDGRAVADTPLKEIGPDHFTAYRMQFAQWEASGFDSVVSRVQQFFRWCVAMEYIDRFKMGPEFRRPAKQEIRDARMDLAKSYTAAELAKLYLAGNITERCWLALGVCGAFNNGDVGNLPRAKPILDLEKGVIDYRRRKTGKKRRVVPLPPDVVTLLKSYRRPDPAEPRWDDLFFITRHGMPYVRTRNRKGGYGPSNAISSVWFDLEEKAGVLHRKKRGFSGVRTFVFNAWPRGERGGGDWEQERRIVMGRGLVGIDMDHYLEDVGLDRLRHCVNHNWGLVRAEIEKLNTSRPGQGSVSS